MATPANTMNPVATAVPRGCTLVEDMGVSLALDPCSGSLLRILALDPCSGSLLWIRMNDEHAGSKPPWRHPRRSHSSEPDERDRPPPDQISPSSRPRSTASRRELTPSLR